MKICSKCKQEKDDSEFYVRKNRSKQGSGLTSMCKDCTLQYMKDKHEVLKEQISSYKSQKGCAVCGESRHYMLDFHHNDPSEKELTISDHCRKTFKSLLPEIEKCSILCANHHREFHYQNSLTGISTQDYMKNTKNEKSRSNTSEVSANS